MNLWECDFEGCSTKATGTGGAIGLTAIGWWFKPTGYGGGGPALLCPAHRPDPIPCTDNTRDDETGEYARRGTPCPSCRANEVADVIQHAIAHHYEQLVAWDAERRLINKPAVTLP